MNKVNPKCSVSGCDRNADYRVMLYDFYPYGDSTLFIEQDHTCLFICGQHAAENENKACGERKPRGITSYPHSNKYNAQGFTIYLPLDRETTD
jgi:hypothetical protein